MHQVTVIGAGLAGSEAAWTIARLGLKVRLLEMRPARTTKAHKTASCAELVCSNSFRGAALTNAVGLLKAELQEFGSLIMEAALASQVPAGGALAVDRALFSEYVHSRITSHPNISFQIEEVTDIPPVSESAPVIIATGPLTSPTLTRAIEVLMGSGQLAFFDAISPIILGNSIDHSQIFRASRYDKGGGADYLNIPLDETQYYHFVDEIIRAEKFGGHEEVESDSIQELRPFEGCMPIEDMAARGKDTLLFGPLKPTGLRDPRTNRRPFAVVQLRQDDKLGALWSMVGFQTRMKHPDQLRVLRMLPGLQHAEFIRLGSVHRNTFLDSPSCLAPTLQSRGCRGLFFAGQITGVEGYVESTAAGLVAGINAARLVLGKPLIELPCTTAAGALLAYISDPERKCFQPMNVSFGLMPSYTAGVESRAQSKDNFRLAVSQNALTTVRALRNEIFEDKHPSIVCA